MNTKTKMLILPMVGLILMFGTILGFQAAYAACPDLSGTYKFDRANCQIKQNGMYKKYLPFEFDKNGYMGIADKTEFTITQSGCENMHFDYLTPDTNDPQKTSHDISLENEKQRVSMDNDGITIRRKNLSVGPGYGFIFGYDRERHNLYLDEKGDLHYEFSGRTATAFLVVPILINESIDCVYPRAE